ncbi:hypothetical protein GGI42DRAFT_324869 [Trichoderma sp. SZMC 28013]
MKLSSFPNPPRISTALAISPRLLSWWSSWHTERVIVTIFFLLYPVALPAFATTLGLQFLGANLIIWPLLLTSSAPGMMHSLHLVQSSFFFFAIDGKCAECKRCPIVT